MVPNERRRTGIEQVKVVGLVQVVVALTQAPIEESTPGRLQQLPHEKKNIHKQINEEGGTGEVGSRRFKQGVGSLNRLPRCPSLQYGRLGTGRLVDSRPISAPYHFCL